MIATDLDGTLLRSDGTLSPRTLAALRTAAVEGIHLVVATARPYRALRPIVDDTDLEGWGVCQNGAVTYELSSRERLFARELALDTARSIVVRLRAAADGVVFACEADDLFHAEPAFAPGLQAMEPPQVIYGDALDLIAMPLTKLLAHHGSLPPQELLRAARDVAGEHAVVTHSGAPFVEISAAGVTKAAGVAALCAHLGVDAADVIAFGDAHNDLAMLRWAGYRVAVSNAHPDILAEADEIAPSNDDDGVAVVVERWLS